MRWDYDHHKALQADQLRKANLRRLAEEAVREPQHQRRPKRHQPERDSE